MNARRQTVIRLALAAAMFVAFSAAGPASADPNETFIISNASLAGTSGGGFAAHSHPLTACTEYTLRMNYNMVPSGTPVENAIGFQVWNNTGDANLTSRPYGQRKWHGASQKYYLESVRRSDVPSIEEIKFKVDCADTSPNYSFRVFNYEPGSTLNYSLSLPGGGEG